jgi:protocatechuate 3,4-dioxygenase beta subunit
MDERDGDPPPTSAEAPDEDGELFSEARSAAVVAASFDRTADPRLRQIMVSLVEHLHGFISDVGLTGTEWETAIRFLTETGRTCTDTRQEFILLSDVLGASMLVETINNRADGGVTSSTVEGPFHLVASPPRELGATIAEDGQGEPCLVTGSVADPDDRPVPGAIVDVWQADDDGFYDVQRPGLQPEGNLRGLFTADDDGRFWFRTVVPRFYPIPEDGPVGALLRATSRHPYRPAHIHVEVAAPGMRTVTTHVFVDGTPYLTSDAVFGVKDDLVREFPVVDDAERAAEVGLRNPFRTVRFDVVLGPDAAGRAGTTGVAEAAA